MDVLYAILAIIWIIIAIKNFAKHQRTLYVIIDGFIGIGFFCVLIPNRKIHLITGLVLILLIFIEIISDVVSTLKRNRKAVEKYKKYENSVH